MKRILIFAALLAGLFVQTAFAQEPERVQQTNPIIWADVPDTSVLRVGDTYYMSSTTMHLSPGLPIYYSKDLVNWKLASYAHGNLADMDSLNLNNGKNEYGRGTWASSLRFHDGKFYVSTFAVTTRKTYVFTTDDPLPGKWEMKSFEPMLHDSSLFFDDDGRVYMIYGAGTIRIRELKPDCSGVLDGGVDQPIIRDVCRAANGRGGLGEGSQMFKVNGKYYLFNITWPGGDMRTEVVSRADKITGPYETRVCMHDRGIAQGGIFDTPDGKWMAVLFRDAGAVGRMPYVMPVEWVDGWPVLGVDGKVPEKIDSLSAHNSQIPDIVTSDEFNSPALNPAWQWNHNPVPDDWSLTEREGWLRLKTRRVDKDVTQARNTLTQRTFGPTCAAVVKLDCSALRDGDYAGLVALQKFYGFIGVKKENGKNKAVVVLNDRRNNGQKVETVVKEFDENVVYLKISCDFRAQTDSARFSYSLDGSSWTTVPDELKMSYTLPHFMGYRFCLFYFSTQTPGGTADFDWYQVGLDAAAEDFSAVPTLKDKFAGKFDIGCAVTPFQFRNPELSAHIARQFNSLTAENCMKPEAIYRPDGNYSFEQADALASFAQEHGMKMRGHTLVWHSQTPQSFFQDENGQRLSKEALYQRMEEYMTKVLTHFKGKVYCWDVVNEALADWGDDVYRKHSPWYEICGEDFIAQAFRTAHKIDPNIKLFYNDYNLINPGKRARAVKMLKSLIDAGVPIDGVGMQAHWNIESFNPEELQKSIDAFTELGLEVQITELDMTTYSNYHGPDALRQNQAHQEHEYTPAIAQKQADAYAKAFDVLVKNADKITAVTFWGASDRYSWLSGFPRRGRKDYPLLFDRENNPKPAFYRVISD
ncbi:MAG: endo-1,4-beta-xylanase [Thermoguttaceae bacterium]|nr:endo-1,4-beta-xylanase [Thermoguttaceae bacterium]